MDIAGRRGQPCHHLVFARGGENPLCQFRYQPVMHRHPPLEDRMALGVRVAMGVPMTLGVASLRRRHMGDDVTDDAFFIRLERLGRFRIGYEQILCPAFLQHAGESRTCPKAFSRALRLRGVNARIDFRFHVIFEIFPPKLESEFTVGERELLNRTVARARIQHPPECAGPAREA